MKLPNYLGCINFPVYLIIVHVEILSNQLINSKKLNNKVMIALVTLIVIELQQ